MNKYNPRTTTFFAIISLLAVVGFPLHLYYFGFAWWHLALLVGMFSLSLISITCGYHRLYAHRSYEAAWPVRLFFLIFGAGSFQESCMKWASQHRVHHHYVDTPKDPYSRKRGFWWSHMGWIISSENVNAPEHPDLLNDPLIMWQKRNWIVIGSIVSFILPFCIGLYLGDPLGGLLYGGILRLFIAHQATFSINSVAHTLGTQPYSKENTAKDHWITSILTFGEGYHNFHHWYARDYRNGVKAHQWDPGKWIIKSLNCLGLTWNLRKVSEEAILNARAKVQLTQVKSKLDPSVLNQMSERYAGFKVELNHKYDELNAKYEQLKTEMDTFADAKKQWALSKRDRSGAALLEQKEQLQNTFKLKHKEMQRNMILTRRKMRQSYKELCAMAKQVQQQSQLALG